DRLLRRGHLPSDGLLRGRGLLGDRLLGGRRLLGRSLLRYRLLGRSFLRYGLLGRSLLRHGLLGRSLSRYGLLGRSLLRHGLLGRSPSRCGHVRASSAAEIGESLRRCNKVDGDFGTTSTRRAVVVRRVKRTVKGMTISAIIAIELKPLLRSGFTLAIFL